MSDIFISYRREDSADVTGRINDHFCRAFGEERIFTDVDNIPLGVDFREHIDREVSHCEVLIAVIGPQWATIKNERGERRLEDPADFVRLEIESALKRDIPVIPVLVRRAVMPTEGQLPDSIKLLAFRNGIPVRPDPDFRNDIKRLIKGIENHLAKNEPDLNGLQPKIEQQESHDQERARAEREQPLAHPVKPDADVGKTKIEDRKSGIQESDISTAEPKASCRADSLVPPRPGITEQVRDRWGKLEILMRPMAILILAVSLAAIGYFAQQTLESREQQQADWDKKTQPQDPEQELLQREAEIHALLTEAQRYIDSDSLMDPAVIEILQRVQGLDPDNPRAFQMLEDILRLNIELGYDALARGDFDLAIEHRNRARRIPIDSPGLLESLDKLSRAVDEAR